MKKMHYKNPARMGGLARISLYGNPGTQEGRSRGGKNSLATHQKNKTGFKILLKVRTPKKSRALAELIGIFMGDGNVGEYQASVVTNMTTDFDHALYVSDLIKKLFGVSVSLLTRPDSNACVVCVSSKRFCELLIKYGMVSGNKVAQQIAMPLWIRRSRTYRKNFIRGLFDTDGSVYTDRKFHKGKFYYYTSMSFSNRSLPLIKAFKEELLHLGLHPTQKTKYAVFLRRKSDILAYFRIVGTSNLKHLKKVPGSVS